LALATWVLRFRIRSAKPHPIANWTRLIDGMQSKRLDASYQLNLMEVLNDIELHRKDKPLATSESQSLNESEQIVLMDGIAGIYPKVTAQNNSWTPTYVYILRSSVRSKLGIAQNISFARWKELFPELADSVLLPDSTHKQNPS
jgi:hypothetical protein